MKKVLITLFASLVSVSSSFAIELGLPTDCKMKNACFVQSYVDHSTYPNTSNPIVPAVDFKCGPLARRGYWATDFQLIHYNHQNAPAVMAAADGKVKAVRRTLPDRVQDRYIPYQAQAGKEAGNSVIIDHGNGWETQYNHLKYASVLVTEGQRVAKGDKIAEIGSSGQTTLAKLGFAVRYKNKPIDPFSYGQSWSCEAKGAPLWSDEALVELMYQETGVTRAGFSDSIPEATRLRSGLKISSIRRTSPEQVVFWVDFFGLKENDILYLRITDPVGQLFAEKETIIRTDRQQWLAYVGRRLGNGILTSGVYMAEVIVQRNNKTIINELYPVELTGKRLPPSIPQQF